MRDLLLNDVTRGLCDVTDKIVLVHLVTAVPGTSVSGASRGKYGKYVVIDAKAF